MISEEYRNADCRFASRVVHSEIKEGTMVLEILDNAANKMHMRVQAVQSGVVKINIYREQMHPLPYDFVNPQALQSPPDVAISTDGVLEMKTRDFRLVVDREPFGFTMYGPKGNVLYQEVLDDVDPVGEGADRTMPMGFACDDAGEVLCTNFCARLHYDEHIYGLGERFGTFDKRGQSVVMCNYDTLGCRDERAYKNVPFYLSSRGYGLFVNSHKATQFQIGSESNACISVHCPGEGLEYYLLTGESPVEILSRFSRLTGPAALPPDWSFGLWYSTGFQGADSKAVLGDAARFRKENIPCDVFHFDCYWLREDMWCDFVWDAAAYPDRLAMLRQLKEQHYKICLWINPYITIKTDMYREGAEKGYLVRDKDGNPYLADLWHGLLSMCAIVDMTNPDAIAWFSRKIIPLLAEGVDVLKTDFGEEIPADSLFYNGRTGEEMRNVYANLYNTLVYGLVKEHNNQGIVWARSGFAGMQRYPVCWSGDPRSSFEGMAATLRGGLSLGLSGVSFWSHDMGGFYGNVSDDVFVRWCQMGLLTSHSRLHGTSTRAPWDYSAQSLEIVTNFIRLRYRLMPYILATAKACAEQGLPFIAPLLVYHPDDPNTLNIWDQYYFGKDLLVAPVFGGDNAVRMVYLPQGEWVDFLTGAAYPSGWHSISCPLDYMPIFMRQGTVIAQDTAESFYIP